MSVGASLAYPGGRTLAAWSRQLAGLHPEALWVGYLTFHRLEAPVCALRSHQLPPLELFVLRALALQPAAELTALAGLLHLDPQLIGRVIRHLEDEGLIRASAAAREVSEVGRQALAQGDYLRSRHERRQFYFWRADWPRPEASRFVALTHPDKLAWLSGPDVPFDLAPLRTAVQQSADWKRRHSFPQDIREVLTPVAPGAAPAWEQVAVANAQRLFAAVVRTRGDEGPMLAGLEVNARHWELHTTPPAFVVPEEDWMPAVAENEWRQAFAEWCQQRQIPAEEVAGCTLTVQGDRLLVDGPAAVQERLHGAKGETWILAGEGLVKSAARLEVQSQ